MHPLTLFIVLLALAFIGYFAGRRRSTSLARDAGGIRALNSLPAYHGWLTALWAGLPALVLMVLWLILEPSVLTHIVVTAMPREIRDLPPDRLGLVVNDLHNLAAGDMASALDPAIQAAAEHYLMLKQLSHAALAVIVLMTGAAGLSLGWRAISPRLQARHKVERVVTMVLALCATLAIFTTIGIVISLLFESLRFFRNVPLNEFLFGLQWGPQTAIRADQVGATGAFGAVPLFAGTALISAVAMAVAVPIGLLSAIYLSEYAAPGFRTTAKPVLEILAGIPTVVYGFFAALTVAPLVRRAGEAVGLSVSSESALAAGLVMGVMIIPFISSLSDDVIRAVPHSMRDGSLAMGATRSETVRKVIIPAALPGIVGGILLAVSRAIGETMIVVMAAGLSANLTANPLASVTTVTVQIVTLLTGDQEFDSPKTLSAFALGLVLFFVTLLLNIIALQVVRKYREQYE